MTGTRKPRNTGTSEPSPTAATSAIKCGWCGTAITVKARGRTPKWCSEACRHRAWEQSRAAASGQAAVQVVERVVTVERTVKVAEQRLPRGREWTDHLHSLTRQVDDGRLYDRDLREVAAAAVTLNNALHRRLARHDRRHRHY
jgi:hypothetical protein